MTDPITLPPGVALGVIAFLLSLLPAGFFLWLWYLRHRDRAVPARSIALAFAAGLALVVPAFYLEDLAGRLWQIMSPSTAHFFHGSVLPLIRAADVLLPAIGTFLVVAVVEEGLRYGLLRFWFKRSRVVDQVSDGLLLGVATGLGFATLENTIYFLGLFREGSFDTLVFVFFLRFLISTMAHISFGGLMGTLLARGTFELYSARVYFRLAFLVPWFLHGLYDLLLGIQFGLYAVVILVPPLLVFFYWTSRRDFFIIHRQDGTMLAQGKLPQTKESEAVTKLLKTMDSPWNVSAPWLSQSKSYHRILDSLTHDE